MDTTIALYSHDSVGLGHSRRNRALAHALAEQLPALTGGSVGGLLIAGHPDAGRDPLPEGWDWLVLPGMTRTRGGYRARRLGLGGDALRDLRSATIDAALAVLEPDLFIADRHPFGIDGELRPVLANLRSRGTATVLGLREVLDTPRAAAAEWDGLGGAELVASYLDAVWVYGDAQVYDPRRTGELPPSLARKATLTGYLSNGRPAARPLSPARSSLAPTPPYVLTVLGGGSDGAEPARLAVSARLPAGHRHLLITGPQMPAQDIEEIRELAEIADRAAGTEGATTVQRSAPDVPELIAEAASVVCMGGYNTIAEVMATDTPALVVPRYRRRQEQPRRARALAAVGALETCDPETLTAADLTAWWNRSVTDRTDRSHIDLDGLGVVPRLAAELLPASVPAHPEVSRHVG
ncbi:glycosyl transferase [Brachybacterium vulturis]|uniref:Glycosyl transferase n=1 Tax=Brachybacterium vulturis TaxID=2017484 RepID=A0A291GK70_9MICO|nr:glycosyltransferase [Brachybacterium vulturis]ATG50374.1 glycosyl transferase [Brachybacterium vulturis]